MNRKPTMNPLTEHARRLHTVNTVADAHNDLLMSVVARPVETWAPHFTQQWLPQLIDGGVNLQVLPVFVDPFHKPEAALREMIRTVECSHRILEANQESTAFCTTGAQIDEALGAGKISCVLALESVPGLDNDIELLETLYRLGVRIASLAHTGRTALADGSEEDATGSRLTRSGAAAVAEMNRLGMILDVSHLGIAGVEHALELTTRPVIATHSASRAQFDHHRNLSDTQLAALAQNDALICVNFYAPFLDQTSHTLERLVDHVEHIAGIVGVHRVGIGADFISEVLNDTTPPCCEEDLKLDAYIPGLEGPRGLPLFTEALVSRGWSDEDVIAVIGGNMRQFLTRELSTSVRSAAQAFTGA